MTAAAEEAVGSISEMLSILMKRRDTLCLLPIEESTRCLASSSFSATMSLVNDWMVRPLGKRPTTRYACIGPATEGSALNAMGYTWTRRRNQHGCERAERSVESRRSWLMSAFLPLLLFGAPWGGAPDLPATPANMSTNGTFGWGRACLQGRVWRAWKGCGPHPRCILGGCAM